jgi:alpha-mannosidase
VVNGAAFDLGSGSGSVAVENQGPVSVTLRVSAGGTPSHTTRVTLYTGLDRIDVEGRISQNFGNLVAYQSTFNYSNITMRHEEVGMIAKVAREDNGGDYANENTRTDWLTLNHFVDVSQATKGVTLSAWDSPFFQSGTSTATHLDATTPSVRCVVGMLPDCAGGIPNQGGDSNFLQRFSLRTHGAWDPAAAERFALEHQNPLEATPATGGADALLPTSPWSLVTINGSDVLLWALKPADDGIDHGIVLRVWNLADTTRNAAVMLNHQFPLYDARVTTHIETDLEPATRTGSVVTDQLARQQLRTWRLVPVSPLTSVDDLPFVGGLAIFPNPGHATHAQTIAFTTSREQHVRITVHDLRGGIVATLANGVWPPGRNEVKWQVQGVPAGVYFVRAQAGRDVLTGRTVVIQ